MRTTTIQTNKGSYSDLESRIITAIESAGPRNIAQISRMTGAHQETIRYKIKKRFARLGFNFHAEVDFDRLGLRLHWGTLDFSESCHDAAPEILRTLSEVGYLTYSAKVVPQGNYIGLFALPNDTTGQYREFLSELSGKGFLNNFTLEEVLSSRHKAMDPRFFNFRAGRWEVDWNKVANQPPQPLPAERKAHAENFDAYDLLVIKELQRDSLQHLTTIAKKLRIHQKTLEYHYRTHVHKLKLIPSYKVSWAQSASRRPFHSTVTARLVFHSSSKQELAKIQGAVSKIPFLWEEDLLQNDAYVATLHAPATEIVGFSSYISESIRDSGSKIDVGFIKPGDAISQTIPYGLYRSDGWQFNTREMTDALVSKAGHSSR